MADRDRDEMERNLPQSDDEIRGFESDADFEDMDDLEDSENQDEHESENE